jgi:hypothetical protein
MPESHDAIIRVSREEPVQVAVVQETHEFHEITLDRHADSIVADPDAIRVASTSQLLEVADCRWVGRRLDLLDHLADPVER